MWSRGYDAESTYKGLRPALCSNPPRSPAGKTRSQCTRRQPRAVPGARSPRLDFDENDGGRVFVVWVECEDGTSGCNRIVAATCTLTGTDACGIPQDVYEDTKQRRHVERARHRRPTTARPATRHLEQAGGYVQPGTVVRPYRPGATPRQDRQYRRQFCQSVIDLDRRRRRPVARDLV